LHVRQALPERREASCDGNRASSDLLEGLVRRGALTVFKRLGQPMERLMKGLVGLAER